MIICVICYCSSQSINHSCWIDMLMADNRCFFSPENYISAKIFQRWLAVDAIKMGGRARADVSLSHAMQLNENLYFRNTANAIAKRHGFVVHYSFSFNWCVRGTFLLCVPTIYNGKYRIAKIKTKQKSFEHWLYFSCVWVNWINSLQ